MIRLEVLKLSHEQKVRCYYDVKIHVDKNYETLVFNFLCRFDCSTKSFDNEFHSSVISSTMKSLAIILFLSLSFISGDSEGNCNSWPTNLKTVRECCVLPHFISEQLRHYCYLTCNGKDFSQQSDCASDCYINKSEILNGTSINKAAVKRIYDGHAPLQRREWEKILTNALNNCKFDTAGFKTQNLIKFYECVNEYLANNCIRFHQTPECQAVEDHHEKCKNSSIDCTIVPSKIEERECCNCHLLFSQELKTKCSLECEKKDFLWMLNHKCYYECRDNKTLQMIDGKAENLKKLLMENSNNITEWEKPIDESVKSCEKHCKKLFIRSKNFN